MTVNMKDVRFTDPVTLILAPIGSGKTVAAKEFEASEMIDVIDLDYRDFYHTMEHKGIDTGHEKPFIDYVLQVMEVMKTNVSLKDKGAKTFIVISNINNLRPELNSRGVPYYNISRYGHEEEEMSHWPDRYDYSNLTNEKLVTIKADDDNDEKFVLDFIIDGLYHTDEVTSEVMRRMKYKYANALSRAIIKNFRNRDYECEGFLTQDGRLAIITEELPVNELYKIFRKSGIGKLNAEYAAGYRAETFLDDPVIIERFFLQQLTNSFDKLSEPDNFTKENIRKSATGIIPKIAASVSPTCSWMIHDKDRKLWLDIRNGDVNFV